jgi:hypothetical protein
MSPRPHPTAPATLPDHARLRLSPRWTISAPTFDVNPAPTFHISAARPARSRAHPVLIAHGLIRGRDGVCLYSAAPTLSLARDWLRSRRARNPHPRSTVSVHARSAPGSGRSCAPLCFRVAGRLPPCSGSPRTSAQSPSPALVLDSDRTMAGRARSRSRKA